MASEEPSIGAAAVLNVEPDADEWGLVTRAAGFIGSSAYVVTRYDISATVIYIGMAPRGTATSAAAWTIRRIQFTSGNPTVSEWTDQGAGVWDDRATETYS